MKKIYTNDNGRKTFKLDFFYTMAILSAIILLLGFFDETVESNFAQLSLLISIGFNILCDGKDEFITIRWGSTKD